MNPDKLFDYLDGRLPAAERTALEERLISDKQLQREFAVARQIHAGVSGDSREVVLPASPDVSKPGRKMATRIGVAFLVLMFVNVGIGLWFIFRHESNNPNRSLLEAQMRDQIARSIERAATLTPGPNALGITEIVVPAEKDKVNIIAEEVVTIVSRFGGSATKGVPDPGRVSILIDVPANREREFRNAMTSIGGETPGPSNSSAAQEPASSPPAKLEKKSFVVQIVAQTKGSD